jgi:hypothetical protein
MTIVQLIVTIWNCSITLERSSIFENRKSSISIRAFNRSVKLRVLVVLLESLWVISMFLEDLRWFQHEIFFSKFSRTISVRWEWFDGSIDCVFIGDGVWLGLQHLYHTNRGTVPSYQVGTFNIFSMRGTEGKPHSFQYLEVFGRQTWWLEAWWWTELSGQCHSPAAGFWWSKYFSTWDMWKSRLFLMPGSLNLQKTCEKASELKCLFDPFWGWSCLHLHQVPWFFKPILCFFFDAVRDDPKMWAVAAFYPWQGWWWVRGWNPTLHMKNGDEFLIQEWGIPFLTRMKWNDRGILNTAHVNRE